MGNFEKTSLPTEVTYETTTSTAIQAQVELSNADKETQPKEDFKLSKGQIIALTTLLTHQFRFARIKVNRDIDPQVVNKKIVSMRAAKGIITPFLILTAHECIEAGNGCGGRAREHRDQEFPFYLKGNPIKNITPGSTAMAKARTIPIKKKQK